MKSSKPISSQSGHKIQQPTANQRIENPEQIKSTSSVPQTQEETVHTTGGTVIENREKSFLPPENIQLKYKNEKEEDVIGLSPSKKSILKKSSLKDVDTSPKKKGVAFLTNNNEYPRILDDNEDIFIDLFSMIRTRSKSNDAERSHASFLTDQNENRVMKNIVTTNVSVGKAQDGIATLLSEDFNVIEVPLSMLPADIRKGNILKFTIERSVIEEESRKDGIVRAQRELLGDRGLFDEYNKKVEYFKKKKMEMLEASRKGDMDIQRIIDDILVNIEDGSFLDKSGFVEDDRIMRRPESVIEAKLQHLLIIHLVQENSSAFDVVFLYDLKLYLFRF